MIMIVIALQRCRLHVNGGGWELLRLRRCVCRAAKIDLLEKCGWIFSSIEAL